ncbi:pGP6-D family virulence protein [Chlamydiia bacterium]|jgi:hypothetical protein|nr:pGP6-D family virulence protein [Chlamydiia bacterium]
MNKQKNVFLKRFSSQSKENKKVASMATSTSRGELNTFDKMFHPEPFTDQQRTELNNILAPYAENTTVAIDDIKQLEVLASEIKAITKQAVILHGQRIVQAHRILSSYKDGAFSAWLIFTYGNRQTPYNLMRYYQFLNETPPKLKPLIEKMPRQAVYTLASRQATIEDKIRIVQNHHQRTKNELLTIIKRELPVRSSDKRASKHPIWNHLQSIQSLMDLYPTSSLSKKDKEQMVASLESILNTLKYQ